METIAAFFRDGGTFMYFILAVAVIGIAIIVDRVMALIIRNKVDSHALWKRVSKHIADGDFDKARTACKGDAPLLRTMEAAVSAAGMGEKETQSAVDEASLEVIPTIDKRIHYLLTLANISTLFGLLGTIQGLIQAFSAVASAEASLYNTAFGIGVAILFLVMYSVLMSRANRLIDEIDAYSLKIVNMIGRSGKGGAKAD
ncbi:MAG: MotA/TolQ/ExbB proton channel family protein [Deltaproteobacteria bacterium]|nr:MotA/TolQ/ExbB proton channel family protein [Deltaproteobacteria bacterium]